MRSPFRIETRPAALYRPLVAAAVLLAMAAAGPARADEGGDLLEPLFRLLKCTPDLPSFFMGWFCTWV